MRRVVITGMGITSCLGNDLDTVSAALPKGARASPPWPTMPKQACAARSAVASTSIWRR